MATPLILVVNLGATSSKFALFSGETCQAEQSTSLDAALVRASSAEQRTVRLEHLRGFLSSCRVAPSSLAAVAARGGLMKPLPRRGVYQVDALMLDDLSSERYGAHPASLSAPIAADLLQMEHLDIPLFVVDPITIDTLWDEARVSGVPEVMRKGRYHALNVHSTARRAAALLGIELHNSRLVVGHFGSGVSICSLHNGRCVDVNDAQLGEGPFSVSRAGSLPLRGVLDLAYAEKERRTLEQRLSRAAGLSAYTGTADFQEVEHQLERGDSKAHSAYNAMVFQSIKYLAAAAGALGQRPDAIVLTGGMLKSKRFADDLRRGVEWLAPVISLPGEDEMPALAIAALHALQGLEPINSYEQAEDALAAPPRTMQELIRRATTGGTGRFIVAGADLPDIAETVRYCREHGITNFTLLGPKLETAAVMAAQGLNPAELDIRDSVDVVADALALVREDGHAALVKGNCNTAALLKGVLDCLPKDHRPFLSHVAVIENPLSGKLVGITDGGLNVELTLEKKIGLVENAGQMFRALGVGRPHILLAAGMEDKGQDIAPIADAREIVRRHRAGEWPGLVIDGPFGIDVGLSGESAAIKKITSPVGGHADVVVCPSLEACNFAVKMVVLQTGQPWAGLIVGGPFPVVMGSRADTALARVASIALSQLVASGMDNLRAPA
jgi:butyrate kinase